MEERGKEELPLSNTFEPCFLMSAVAGEMEEKVEERGEWEVLISNVLKQCFEVLGWAEEVEKEVNEREDLSSDTFEPCFEVSDDKVEDERKWLGVDIAMLKKGGV